MKGKRLQHGSLALAVILATLLPAVAERSLLLAVDSGGPSSDQIGREAMRSLGSVPWYDAGEDRVQPIEPKNTDAAQWDTPARTSGYRGTASANTNAAPPAVNFFDVLGEVIGWAGLTVIVLLLIAAIVYAWMSHEQQRISRQESLVDEGDREDETVERLQQLPVQVRQPTSNLLAEAKSLMQAGRYNEAIVYLFSHQLIQLDRHQLVRLARGKTNRQYLQELGGATDLLEILDATVRVFEDAFFGEHRISQQRFEFCWNQLERFHAAIDAAHSKASSA